MLRTHLELTGAPDPAKVMEMLSEMDPETREKIMTEAANRWHYM